MKIGVFDSGKGGKLIAQKIAKLLPNDPVIFRADKAYFPYGNKSSHLIQKRLIYFTQVLLKLKCEIIVIACNSATTNAISKLRQTFSTVTFVGIEPPLKPLVALTKTHQVAILGTKATINSVRHKELEEQFSPGITIYNVVCAHLAELIEQNHTPRRETATLLRHYLDAPIKAGVDAVGIACTHYPYLMHQMQQLYPGITFYDPADAVVNQVIKQVKKASQSKL